MTYQLVFQFKGDSLADFDMMVSVEEKMNDQIGNLGEVDGHDIGSGEVNIFVITKDPMAAFLQMKSVLENLNLLSTVSIAYGEIESDSFAVVWPENSKQEFSVA
ncbi:hypothetical protein AAKU58_004357 [Oxalobacteraceae bacterium GrIS 1.18]